MNHLFSAEEPIFNYKHLGIALSWRCDARCTHCFIPHNERRKGLYQRNLVDVILRDLPRNIRIIGFTGGEPFINPELFIKELEKVAQSGRRCTVVTNGLWVRRYKRVDAILGNAYRAGLRSISISYDYYHQPRLDHNEIIDLLRRAREIGLDVNVRGIGKKSTLLIKQIEKSGVLIGQKDATNRYSLDNIGEAERLSNDCVRSLKMDRCLGILYPFVDPDGNIYACCSTRTFMINNNVLSLGNVRDKPISEALDKASRDYLLVALLVLGPKALCKMADPRVDIDRSRYHCEVCVSLLNDIQKLETIRERINNDHNLRKNLVGRYMIYEHCYRPEMHPVFDT